LNRFLRDVAPVADTVAHGDGRSGESQQFVCANSSPVRDASPCVVLVPVQSAIEPACEAALVALERRGYAVRRVRGYAAIDQGRNQMATDALRDGFEETMWIDSDIAFDPNDIERLRAHRLPIVSAIYADTRIRLGHVGTYSYTWEDAGTSKRRFPSFRLRLGSEEAPNGEPHAPSQPNQGTASKPSAVSTPLVRSAAETVASPAAPQPRTAARESHAADSSRTAQGVLYVATGKQYIAEACRSAESCQGRMPDLPRAIICDDPSLLAEDCFDIVERFDAPTYSHLDKIAGMRRSPFRRTLYLDTDTVVAEPICELFELLERFDLAAAHAPWRWTRPADGCPESFPELNTGVVVYRSGPALQSFLERWETIFSAHLASAQGAAHDQPAFRQAVYESDLRLTVLTPEYNLRTVFPSFAGGNARVKILHGRGRSLERMLKIANLRTGPRVFSLPGAVGKGRNLSNDRRPQRP